jgi:hypothetical protein
MRCLLALCLSLSLLGCASSRDTSWHTDWARGSDRDSDHDSLVKDEGLMRAPPPVAPAPPPPVTAVPFDARTFAQRYPNPETCEAAARQLRLSSPDDGWAALRACVNGTHFTQIRSLLVPEWEEDLKTRKDAATLLTKVVATRGGSINAELSLLHTRRIPLFSLAAAMAQPKTYNGRYLLVRAQVSNMRTEKGVPTVTLTEYTIGSVGSEADVGLRHHDSKEESGHIKARMRSDRLGSAEGEVSYAHKSSGMSHDTEMRYDNVSQETGREALGKLPKDDPFLVPGKELIILARFDGVRRVASQEEEDDEPHQIAVLTLYNYYEPNPAVAY